MHYTPIPHPLLLLPVYSFEEHRPLTNSVLGVASKVMPSVASLCHLLCCWSSPRISGSSSGASSWGFHWKDCLVILPGAFFRVCPIQVHLRFLICMGSGSCVVSFQRSSLLMRFGQYTPYIRLRLLFINNWILLSEATVILHNSSRFLDRLIY